MVSHPFGVLYFVDENPAYRRMMQISIESLREFHPDWPIEVVTCKSTLVRPLTKAYRAVSFWKWKQRRNRLGQDRQIFQRKAEALINSPFEHTLFLDVDTVIRRPLDGLRERAMSADALLTAMPWKQYPRIEPDLPAHIPFVMSGVFFFGRRFSDACRPYVAHFGSRLHEIVDGFVLGDQFVFSLVCVSEPNSLTINYEPHLQIDVINAEQHLSTVDYPRQGKCLDINWEGLAPFHVFHYNEYKTQYMRQIKEVWHLPSGDDVKVK